MVEIVSGNLTKENNLCRLVKFPRNLKSYDTPFLAHFRYLKSLCLETHKSVLHKTQLLKSCLAYLDAKAYENYSTCFFCQDFPI